MTSAQEIRAGLEAIAQGLCAIAVALRPSMSDAGCDHPQDQRDYGEATMGHIRWSCRACGYGFDDRRGS